MSDLIKEGYVTLREMPMGRESRLIPEVAVSTVETAFNLSTQYTGVRSQRDGELCAISAMF